MSVSLQTQEKFPDLRIELDGRDVDLPRQMANSLVAIRAYLEFLALQQRRVLSGFTVDGIEIRQLREEAPAGGFRHIRADTITFEQLSHRLIETACRQLHYLAAQIEESTLRVLISDWRPIHNQWQEWQPQFRTPLISLGFLRELWGPAVDTIRIGGQTLAEHLDGLNPMLCEADALLMATELHWSEDDAIALSGLFEERLVPWIRMLEVYLLKLNHQPVS
ncbi:MAG TPA: hypothetical protein DCY13_05725 [Verrucomicrobiales bacterium]|nr:hypothetical protein [Verrucomicrobiales bacterium]